MGRPGATDSEALMKAGLILVLLGHGILLLGALVHGIVLRQVGLSEQAPAVESTAANIAALLAGLVGTIIGISIIILAKNRDSRTLMWLLLAGSVPGALLAAGSALCLTVTLVKVVVGGRRSLLLQCQLPDMANYSDVHNDYPFSSNHIYGTTLALWVPLLVLCVVESVYFVRCCLASISLLHLPCPSWVWRRTFIKKQDVGLKATTWLTNHYCGSKKDGSGDIDKSRGSDVGFQHGASETRGGASETPGGASETEGGASETPGGTKETGGRPSAALGEASVTEQGATATVCGASETGGGVSWTLGGASGAEAGASETPAGATGIEGGPTARLRGVLGTGGEASETPGEGSGTDGGTSASLGGASRIGGRA